MKSIISFFWSRISANCGFEDETRHGMSVDYDPARARRALIALQKVQEDWRRQGIRFADIQSFKRESARALPGAQDKPAT